MRVKPEAHRAVAQEHDAEDRRDDVENGEQAAAFEAKGEGRERSYTRRAEMRSASG
jgi:hypothetical protein